MPVREAPRHLCERPIASSKTYLPALLSTLDEHFAGMLQRWAYKSVRRRHRQRESNKPRHPGAWHTKPLVVRHPAPHPGLLLDQDGHKFRSHKIFCLVKGNLSSSRQGRSQCRVPSLSQIPRGQTRLRRPRTFMVRCQESRPSPTRVCEALLTTKVAAFVSGTKLALGQPLFRFEASPIPAHSM